MSTKQPTIQAVTTPHPFARLQNPSRWEITRMVLGIVTGLVPLRLLVLIISILVGGFLTVALFHLGFSSLCVYNLRFFCRLLLWVSGHFWIPLQGASQNVFDKGGCPRIIVSNHISNMEILHLLTLPFQDSFGNPVLPVFVTKESIFDLPIIGTITKDVLGSIGVSRKKVTTTVKQQQEQSTTAVTAAATASTSTIKNNDTTEQILARVRAADRRKGERTIGRGPIVIFPEGTTTNGTCLLAFKKGAFVPMVAVRPVLYSFGANAADPESSAFLPTYESIWGPAYLWRLLCQPIHRFECTFLETIAPEDDKDLGRATSNVEKESQPSAGAWSKGNRIGTDADDNDEAVSLFADTVRRQMSERGDLPMLSKEYNYRHKLQYHNGLRKAFVSHPRGPKHAMCFAPMQKVLPPITMDENEPSRERESMTREADSVGYDVVVGTKFISAQGGANANFDFREKKDS